MAKKDFWFYFPDSSISIEADFPVISKTIALFTECFQKIMEKTEKYLAVESSYGV